MEYDASSCTISCAKILNMPAKTSDSNNSNDYYALPASKRMRHDNAVININAPSTTATAKFKGVVPQQNGHWGSQIYANHQRIWLGTFRSEKEAAMAYDSAAIKLRSGDSQYRNFPCTDRTAQEPTFQNHYSTEAVLNMIRDGSYPSKFAAFLRTQSQNNENIGICILKQTRIVHGDGHFSCSQLFQKELTPSDVGKLNRLVIPKKYAVRYFPYICESLESKSTTTTGLSGTAHVDDVELIFYDKQMKQWKFRYCYWRSSQSFVFTRGWNKFVKEKKLNALDIITFYTCESGEKGKVGETFCFIDVIYNGVDHQSKNCLAEYQGIGDDQSSAQVELELNLGKNVGYEVDYKDDKVSYSKEDDQKVRLNMDEKGIRIFGVQLTGIRS
ncbi:hypothetical protein F2P56_033456 [Juglans regia]|uniref:AP2/ERF and B3 domain-containing transcription factor At1g50680-like n=2 Tax=Juglans regia TaxID=51240 RepID=A0A2I4FS83_JUGRE|nr:AP2/ERF and B3 domain-containing transcription factor At1g50680-like [Juglans regia]KAF5447946.1 hypothetical protein F2P56_033456 [Juglans regia]